MDDTSEIPLTLSQGESVPPHHVCGMPALEDYDLLDKLGEGGMGVVFKAREKSLHRLVAIKMIRAGLYASDRDLARFQTEAEAVAQLRHPNVVQVYRVGRYEDTPGLWRPYMVLEYVEGGSLADRLDGTPLAAKTVAPLMESMARAVQSAHDVGIVHRDLKPANILLAACGAVKVADFGLARRVEDEGQTVAGAILGTPSYMSPEQAAGHSRVDGRADVYSLGAILYECLTGRPPFRGATLTETLQQVRESEVVPPSQLVPRLPRDLETICLKCLRKEPERRYASAGELADDLGRFSRGEAINARPVGKVERLWRWCLRHPAQAILSAALLLVTVGGVLGIWDQWRRAETKREEAERRFKLALKTNLSVGELAERLRPIAGTQTATVEEVLRTAERNYETFLEEVGPLPEVLAGKARMLTAFSELYWIMNRSGRALETAREAIDLWRELGESDTRNDDYREGMALAQVRLSHALFSRGNSKEAEAAARASLRLRQQQRDEKPGDAERQTSVILSRMSLTRVLTAQGNDEEAETLTRETDAQLDAMARMGTHSARWQFAYIRSCRARADQQYNVGKYDEAMAAYRKVRDECMGFLKENPDDNDLQGELVETEAYIGYALQRIGKATEAKAAFRTAREQAESFARNDPNHVTWRRALIHYRLLESDVVENAATLSREPLIASLREHLDERLSIGRLVAQQKRGDPENRQLEGESVGLLLDACSTRAALLLLGDEPETHSREALDDLRAARERCEALVRHDPLSYRWASLQWRVPEMAHQVLRVLGRQREALEQQREAADLERRWCRDHCSRRPDSRRRVLDLARSHFMLGLRWSHLSDWDPSSDTATRQAVEPLRESRKMYHSIADVDHDNLDLLNKLLRTVEVMDGALLRLGHWTEVEKGEKTTKALEERQTELRKQQSLLPALPTYPECSALRKAQWLVQNAENIDQARDRLNKEERDFLYQPTAHQALHVLQFCHDLSRQLMETNSPRFEQETRRVASRGLAMREVIEREGAIGESVKKVLTDMSEVRARRPESSDPILSDEKSRAERDRLDYGTLAQSLLQQGRKSDLFRFVIRELRETEFCPTWQARLVLEVGMNARVRSILADNTEAVKDPLDRRRLAAFLWLSGDEKAKRDDVSSRVIDVLQGYLSQNRRWAECERLLTGAESAAWRESLFDCQFAMKKYESAEETLTALERDVPPSVVNRRRRGLFSFEQRHFDRAERAFRALLEDPSPRAAGWKMFGPFMLARLYLERGETPKARTESEAYSKAAPESPYAFYLSAYVQLVGEKDPVAAERSMKQALAMAPQNPELLKLAAWIETYGPEPEKALERLEKWFDRASRDPVEWDHLGDVYARLQNKEKARASWRKALETMPSTVPSEDRRKKDLERKLHSSGP